MTACIPDDPAYCFCPIAEEDGEPPQIRILVEGLIFAIPTALVALDREQGLDVIAVGTPVARRPPHRSGRAR